MVTVLRSFALMVFLLVLPTAHAGLLTDPKDVRLPPAGIEAPDADLQTLDGKPTRIAMLRAGKPALLVFYRGGWCPYCNLQLSELRNLKPLLAEHDVQLIAVSPDRPEELRKSLDKHELDYILASDASADLMQAYGIGFRVDDATIEKYKGYGIDLEQASGAKHHALPVPSVFLIDAAGTLQFVYANPNYTTRVPERLLRAAVESLAHREFGKSLK